MNLSPRSPDEKLIVVHQRATRSQSLKVNRSGPRGSPLPVSEQAPNRRVSPRVMKTKIQKSKKMDNNSKLKEKQAKVQNSKRSLPDSAPVEQVTTTKKRKLIYSEKR